jgi:hypothetical protein
MAYLTFGGFELGLHARPRLVRNFRAVFPFGEWGFFMIDVFHWSLAQLVMGWSVLLRSTFLC